MSVTRWIAAVVGLVLALALCLNSTHPLLAQQPDDTLRRHTLAGIRQIVVLVTVPVGEDTSDYRTQAELRLRTAGVPVAAVNADTLMDVSNAQFVITLSETGPKPPTGWTFSAGIMQSVCLVRNPIVCTLAETWTADGSLGYGPPASLHDTILRHVQQAADQLANAFLAANPKH